MLVVLSDLHFVDGTAGEHNLAPEAFYRVFADDIVGVARSKAIEEVDILLLGDIFDLLRTEQWFEVAIDARPWGRDTQACLEHADKILKDILEHVVERDGKRVIDNPAIFRFFREELPKRLAEVGVKKTTIHYVPGNHDRLVNAAPALRDRVAAALGIDLAGGWFPNAYRSERYGVIARHGHEFDHLNCASSAKPYDDPKTTSELERRRRDYAEHTSIGDVITTELAARLPHLVRTRLDDPDPLLVERFQEIENVRPLSGILAFLRYQARTTGERWKAIEGLLIEAVEYFLGLDFVRNYDKEHGLFPLGDRDADIVDQIQIALRTLRILGLEPTLKLAEKLGILPRDDAEDNEDEREAALREPGIACIEDPIRFVLYGHTHGPRVLPLTYLHSPDFKQVKECQLVNTGTWRARFRQTARRDGFTKLQNMTYVLVYDANEDRFDDDHEKPPTLEIWTGSRKKYFI
ncbi:MAG: metallophosphoesterase [Myxococcales bacterium]|nr:metallophosphoesterase [Myxococcales bacterium]